MRIEDYIQKLHLALGAALLLFAGVSAVIYELPPSGQVVEHRRMLTRFSCLYERTVIPDGGHINLYREPSVPAGEHCIYESRYCHVGILTNTYASYPTCYVRARE